MFGGTFSVLFLIFNIPTSICIGEDTMGEGRSSFEVEIFWEEIFQYQLNLCPYESCYDIVRKYSKKCDLRWYKRRPSTAILSCAWLGQVTACVMPKNKHYYKWVKSSELGIHGHGYDSCPTPGEVRSSRGPPHRREQYSDCHCDIIEYSWQIYLGELRSRERDNYVIAGVRFTVQNQTLFLQPAEGKLEANGRISNRSWVPLPQNVDESRSFTIYARTIFFSDLKLDSGYAVTGIQLEGVDRGTNRDISGFAMTISGVPFNDKTGALNLTPERRKTARDSPSTVWSPLMIPRKNPIYSPAAESTYPSPREYNYVRLEGSELSDDFGQSTLPLFDSTPVSFRYAPLAGIGIFHKGSEHHAGYITLRLYPVE